MTNGKYDGRYRERELSGLGLGVRGRIGKAISELRRRYGECDEGGHLRPDSEKDECNYCHRRLDVAAPGTRKREVQKSTDYVRGLVKLAKAMKERKEDRSSA